MVNSRSKGKRGELEAAGQLRQTFGVEARRGRQYHGADDSPDLITSIPGVHFEVKRTEKLSLYAALEQALEDAPGKIPVVLHCRNHRPWLAITPLRSLPELSRIFAVLPPVTDTLSSIGVANG